MHYLWKDVETSGKNPNKHILLTAYFAVYNENHEMIDELELYLKPSHNDPSLVAFEPEAMEITGINLEEHFKDPKTVTYEVGRELLLALLEKHKIAKKRKHYRLCGHNVDFDKHFVFAQLLDQEEWEQYVHYNSIDTLRICTFLQDVGFIPSDLGNLGSLVEYFNVPKGKAHNAREDIKMNVGMYMAIKKMMNEKKGNLSGVASHTLLDIVEI